MTFSCWFFWLLTKLERIFGAASGMSAGATGGGQSAWPFLGHQGAGAFLALTLVGLWLSRSYLKEVWGIAFRGKGANRNGTVSADAEEPMSYRWAFIGYFCRSPFRWDGAWRRGCGAVSRWP